MRFKSSFLAAALIAVGLFFRLYQLEQRASFDFDQEVAAWWVKNLVVDHKISLIGQEISVGGVFIAPFFYYLLAPFYLLTNLYPLGGNILVTLVALITMVAVYVFAKRVFNRSVALMTLFLYAIHPGIVSVDRTVAPSNLIMLLSVSTAAILTASFRRPGHYLVLGGILGLAFSVHPTAVLLIPITVAYFLITKEKINFKNLVLLVGPIILLAAPLVLFDLRHDGLILRHAATALSSSPGADYDLLGHLFSRTELLLVYWAGILISNDAIFIKLPLFALALWTIFKSRGTILKLWVLTSLAALLVYPRHVPEYYFLLTAPIVLIYTVGFLQKTTIGKITLATITISSLVLGIVGLTSPSNLFGLYYKNEAVKHVASESGGEPVTIYYSNEPGRAFGFDYLFWWQGVKRSDNTAKKFLIVVPASGQIKAVPLPEKETPK